MDSFTITGDGAQGDFLVTFPLYAVVGNPTPAGASFVPVAYPAGVCLILFTEEHHGEQAIADINLPGAVLFRIPDPTVLGKFLGAGRATTSATHVAIDVGNRFAHGTGRIRPIPEVLTAIAGE